METSRRMFVVVAMVAIMVAGVGADDSGKTYCSTFPVAGRSFTVVNKPIPPDGDICPDASPNKLDFYPDGTVRIVGNFAGADLGVCDPSINPYTLPADAIVTYEIYCDTVIFRITDRVPAGFRILRVGNEKLAIELSSVGTRYGVSALTDVGAAKKY